MAFAANKWLPVKLEGAIFANAISEGLVGIEECTDYDEACLTFEKKRKKKHTANKSIKKLKITNNDNKQSISPSKQGSTEQNEESVWERTDSTSTQTMKAWEGFCLPGPLLKALQEQGFHQPTEIQAFTLSPALLGRRDILGAAETGSGKTLAFGLPIISGIMRLKEYVDYNSESNGCVKSSSARKPLYALILTPTRELAMQVKNHLVNIAKYARINVAVVVGGMAAIKQERILRQGPEIVVGTPGRLWELIQQGNDHLSQIDHIKFLAIDETDRMLEKGHFKELHDLLERINMDERNKSARQNFVFSATLTLIHDIPRHLLNKSKIKGRKLNDMSPEQKLQKIVDSLGITEPKVVDLSKGTGTSETLTECRISCPIDEKDYFVYYFLKKHPGRTLIFCNSIGCVKRLTTLLGLLDCGPLPLHASMQQRQRLKNLERFRDTEYSILIATDVAARGLDIPKIDHVLHYQTPRTCESYVHRSGRTARASKQGLTVLIMEPNELSNYLKLCKTLGKGEDLPMFPIQEKYLNAVKERVNLARDLDRLQLQLRKANSEEGWLQKAAKEMDILIDGVYRKYDSEEMGSNKHLADLKRKQLTSLLGTPIFPRGFSGKFPLMENASNTNVQEKAIDVMKSALETNRKTKKKPIRLYKATNKKLVGKERSVIIKLAKNKHKNKVH